MHWFGKSFTELDPLLQTLHLNGGTLAGKVNLEFGTGIAGVMGRRLASKLGLPAVHGKFDFNVVISHQDGSLIWSRQFGGYHKMVSTFTPYGEYPAGFWSETTGSLSLILGVDIIDGGWFWVQRKTRFMGMTLPNRLLPAVHAYKRINNGLYEFSVAVTFPVVGKLIRYSGLLAPI